VVRVVVPREESFFTSKLKLLNYKEVIGELLKDLGYATVVFVEVNSGLYTLRDSQFVESARSATGAAEVQEVGYFAYLFNSMSLGEAVEYGKRLLNSGRKTAVVFPNWEVVLQEADGNAQLKEALEQLKESLRVENENLLVMVESPEWRAARQNGSAFLSSTDGESEGAGYGKEVFISLPLEDEVRRLVHYQRLVKEKPLDWEGEEEVVKCLLRGSADWLFSLIRKTNTWERLSVEEVEGSCAEDPWKRLDSLVGLESVKEELRKYVSQFGKLERRHLAFLGNPGVGKTTVARILAAILAEEGLLERGHLVECGAAELIGQYVGETRQKVKKKVQEALGGVLFVDEAYSLMDSYDGGRTGGFGEEAIDELTRLIEFYRDRLVVIFAGYPGKMEELLRATNDGLASRVGFKIRFPDYDRNELEKIFYLKVEKKGRSVSEKLRELLPCVFGAMEDGMKRGVAGVYVNARGVENLVDRLITNAGKSETLDVEHLPREWMYLVNGIDEELLKEVLEEINRLEGLENFKKFVEKLAARRRFEFRQFKGGRRSKLEKPERLHLLFKGNPGTGKTTVARMVGKLFKALYLLPEGHLVETTSGKLLESGVGDSEKRLIQMMDAATGGVLFIDEAGGLVSHGGLISTLIAEMERRRGELSVILAGYPEVIEEIKRVDPGMRGRFMDEIEFEDLPEDLLWEIFRRKLAEKEYSVEEEAKEVFVEQIRRVKEVQGKSFANARTVEGLVDLVIDDMCLRISGGVEDATIRAEDIVNAVNDLLGVQK